MQFMPFMVPVPIPRPELHDDACLSLLSVGARLVPHRAHLELHKVDDLVQVSRTAEPLLELALQRTAATIACLTVAAGEARKNK